MPGENFYEGIFLQMGVFIHLFSLIFLIKKTTQAGPIQPRQAPSWRAECLLTCEIVSDEIKYHLEGAGMFAGFVF